MKFEEDVEEGGNKWSKPHVATLSLHSLFELRSCMLKGTVLLNLEANDLGQIAGIQVYIQYMYMYMPVDPDSDGTYRVILRIVKAGCHPVAIAQVVEH